MIWIIAIPALFFVLTLRNMYADIRAEGFLDHFMYWFFAAFLSFIGLLIACGVGYAIGYAFETEYTLSGQSGLVAIRDKDGTSGSFFLGTGTIEGETYYMYYQQLPDGSLRPGRIKANSSVTIREDGMPGEGVLKSYRCGFSNEAAYMFAIPPCHSRFEFVVPEGTIRRGFTM